MDVIKNKDIVCIIRFVCNNENIAELVNLIENLYNSTFSSLDLNVNFKNFSIEYYRNNGNNRTVRQVYFENVNSKNHFEFNNIRRDFFVSLRREDFLNVADEYKIIVFELQYDEGERKDRNFGNISDPINFQYLLLFMDYMEKKKIRHSVFVSGKADEFLYIPLEEKTYYQIRTFLYFCEDRHNDKIYLLRLLKSNKNWTRLFSDIKKNRTFDNTFGRILPLIPINQKIYKIIQGEEKEIDGENKDYRELVECYKKRICDRNSSKQKELEEYCLYDNYIEELIFLSTLYYCLDEHAEYKSYELNILHETCVDYAQGILQLIENVCFHAIENGVAGCGNFSIRIRKRSEMESFLSDFSHKNSLYFMEIYVTDLIYHDQPFCGIVNKLYDNIGARYDELNDENEKEVLEEVLITRGTEKRIKLQEIFGNNIIPDSPYAKYLNHSVNVAYHYGLQILNNAINVGEGYMCVRSGEGDKNYYSDNNNGRYRDQVFNWKNGTAYIIYLPLDLTETIDYHDSIAILNEFSDEDRNGKIEKFPDELIKEFYDIPFCMTPKEKEQSIFNLVEKIDSSVIEEEGIYYIDCKVIKNKYSYEILAKVIFLCLINKKINNVAIINVKNRQEVVKLFRQFALFYNRQGQNSYMKNKSVFIVDSKAEIDLLLAGTISDIRKDMYRSQIYGGIDETSMRIIEHLGRRGY